jgi:hypothetical protein
MVSFGFNRISVENRAGNVNARSVPHCVRCTTMEYGFLPSGTDRDCRATAETLAPAGAIVLIFSVERNLTVSTACQIHLMPHTAFRLPNDKAINRPVTIRKHSY